MALNNKATLKLQMPLKFCRFLSCKRCLRSEVITVRFRIRPLGSVIKPLYLKLVLLYVKHKQDPTKRRHKIKSKIQLHPVYKLIKIRKEI